MLQRREGRRGIFETMLRGLEGEASRRDSEMAQMQRELASQRERAQALATELNAARIEIGKLSSEARSRTEAGSQALAAAADRQRELESASTAQQSLIDALTVEIAAARAAHAEALAGEQTRRADALRGVQQELQAARERVENAEADVRAAEDTINRLESELRAKTARIEELTKLNDDWRATLESARDSLAERDALIRRLEAEAAHSTALLDNIQHNIRFLDAPAGAEAEAEIATRLLIRAEGDGEVVHVLGRKTSIGRTPDNDVQIDTKFVSRHHAVILAGPAHAIIEDLNSTNGVLVNGRRITRQSLKDGDAITVGKTQFRFAIRSGSERR
jgi:DNA repair exonuclease SbcCD ATPase subunit